MNEAERMRMREKLLRLVRDEPEIAAELLLGLMSGGRFEVVVREERGEAPTRYGGVSHGEGDVPYPGYDVSCAYGSTAGTGYVIVRKD